MEGGFQGVHPVRRTTAFRAMSGSFCQLLDLYVLLVLAGLGQLIGRLHPQQSVGLDAESLLKTNSHISRQVRIAIQQGAQCLPRHAKGLIGDAGRLRKMLAFIDAAESFEELSVPPNFGLHELTGDRKGSWSMTVTRNWRMTFGLNDDGALIDMDLEDYHGA